jgi:RNA polymerase sigma-70 factor (ECF subfamily)
MSATGRRLTQAVQAAEEVLVERARRGEVEAFGLLVEQYQDKLYNFILRIVGQRDDAADIAQETFVRAYRALPQTPFSMRRRRWRLRLVAATGCSACRAALTSPAATPNTSM